MIAKEGPALVSLKGISLSLNNQKILKNINLELKKGEITTLIGPNGGGKTSIARILIGILKPDSGKVFISKKARIGYMPQKLEIEKTIPLKVIDFLNLNHANPGKAQEEIKKFSKKLNIENILEKSIHEISGGQLQKVSLVRSLINNPDLLVLDEPTQYMDIAAQAEFYQIIEEIRTQKHCAVLIISHDLHIVMQKTNQVICVNHHICCEGSPESINNHPEYLSLFGNNKIDNIAIYSHHHDHQH
ncbi:MAG: Zinc transporter, ATP-binding protein ZnuC [Rickettsiaceae bacterium]|nr:Zinc transporter, ATP-binding protein ZnuC [Rickettsiaceae bacterium]